MLLFQPRHTSVCILCAVHEKEKREETVPLEFNLRAKHQPLETYEGLIHPNANVNKIFCLSTHMLSQSSRTQVLSKRKRIFPRICLTINHCWKDAESVSLAVTQVATLTKLLSST